MYTHLELTSFQHLQDVAEFWVSFLCSNYLASLLNSLFLIQTVFYTVNLCQFSLSFHHCRQQIPFSYSSISHFRRSAQDHWILACLLIQIWFPMGNLAPEGRHPLFSLCLPIRATKLQAWFLQISRCLMRKVITRSCDLFPFWGPQPLLFYSLTAANLVIWAS